MPTLRVVDDDEKIVQMVEELMELKGFARRLAVDTPLPPRLVASRVASG